MDVYTVAERDDYGNTQWFYSFRTFKEAVFMVETVQWENWCSYWDEEISDRSTPDYVEFINSFCPPFCKIRRVEPCQWLLTAEFDEVEITITKTELQ